MKYRISVLLMLLLLSGCDSDKPTYTIQQQGEFYADKYYDVIHVYGFGNNRLVTQELVDYLNSVDKTPRKKPYSFYRSE